MAANGKAKLIATIAIFISVLAGQCQHIEAANILGVFTSHSPSHVIVHMSLVKALAEKGHNVTVVTCLQPKITHPGIKVIYIPPTPEDEEKLNLILNKMAGQENGVFTLLKSFFTHFLTFQDMQAKMLKDKRFTDLYKNSDNKFDLIILGYFMNDFQVGIGHKFKAPMIMSWTGPSNQLTDSFIGNPSEVSYVPHMMVGRQSTEKFSFLERLHNVVLHSFFNIFFKIMDFHYETFYRDIFRDDPDMPSLSKMRTNISAVFCNGHFSEGPIRPNLPAIIEIGGIQIKEEPDPLPEDIENFLQSATDGAILFSLGSNLRGEHIKPDTVKKIFKVLSNLKQKVIWKWEDLKNTPGSSPNILYKSWLPQDDILAHPNIQLFITHAGKGGIAEAQYHGVPMLALPVFAEQPANAQKIQDSGYGLKLDLLKLKEDEFKAALLEILHNPKYKQKIEEFSKLYRDRPFSAKDSAVFWVEYIIRHHGAPHLQSPSVHMNFIELYNLDVYFLFTATMLGLYYLYKHIPCIISRKCIKIVNDKKNAPTKSKKNKKDKSQ